MSYSFIKCIENYSHDQAKIQKYYQLETHLSCTPDIT